MVKILSPVVLAILLFGCRRPDGHEVARFVEIPRALSGIGSDLAVSTTTFPPGRQTVYDVNVTDGRKVTLATLGEGKISVDGDIVYYVETRKPGVIAFKAGSAENVAGNIDESSFIAGFDRKLYALNNDFSPKLVRVDLATGSSSIRNLPGLSDRYLGPTIDVRRKDMLYVADYRSGYTFRINNNGDVELVADLRQPLTCFAATEAASWWFVSQGGPLLMAPIGGAIRAVSASGVDMPGDSLLMCTASEKSVFYTIDNRRGIEMITPDGRFREIVRSEGDISAMFADGNVLYWAEVESGHYSVRSLSLRD